MELSIHKIKAWWIKGKKREIWVYSVPIFVGDGKMRNTDGGMGKKSLSTQQFQEQELRDALLEQSSAEQLLLISTHLSPHPINFGMIEFWDDC